MRPRTILLAASASVVLALALVLVLAVGLWADEPAPVVTPAPATGPVVTRVVPVHGGAAARVQGELAELRAEVSRLGAAPAPAPEEALSPEEQQARGDARVAAQAALLAKTFAADVRDPGWSPQTESAVREAFAAAAVPGARLEEVACGGTLCRFTVAFDSIERRDEGAGAVVGLVRWDAIGFGDVSPDDPLRYVVYASRDPDSFPSVP